MAIKYNTLGTLFKRYGLCDNEAEKGLLIYNEVDLDFWYDNDWDEEESIKQRKMVVVPKDDELAELQQLLMNGEGKEHLWPNDSQKKKWSSLLYKGLMN